MGTLLTIIASIVTAGIPIMQVVDSINSAKLRNSIVGIYNKVMKEINNKNLSVNKLTSLLNSNNNTQLQAYLTSNPVVGPSLSKIQENSRLLSQLEAEIQANQSKIDAAMNVMSSTDTSNVFSRKEAENKIREAKDDIDKYTKNIDIYQKKAQDLLDKQNSTNKVDFSAVVQNIKGGLN